MELEAFFACSMRGGYNVVSQEFLQQIPTVLEDIGLKLMSKHQTQKGIIQQENLQTVIAIHNRDYWWLENCDIVIAEISNPSLGVGGEISDGIQLEKAVFALYQIPEEEVSAYIRGKLERYERGGHSSYTDLKDLKRIITDFIEHIF